MKLPWMKFFVRDWMTDPALTLCSPATRGVWMDLLCAMHERGRVGELCGTTDQLARFARCQPAELAQALTDLQTTGAAAVTERNGIVTVVNRRMKREEKARESTRFRVSRYRGNGDVTLEKRVSNAVESRKQKADTKLNRFVGTRASIGGHRRSSDKGDKVLQKLNAAEKHLADAFEKALGDQWVNDAGKWIGRIKRHFSKSERVFYEVHNAVSEGRVKTTPAQYAEQIWKEFAP